MKRMGLLFVAAIVLGCSTRGPVAAPHVFAMSGNQLTMSKGGPVIAPPPGDMAAFWDTDGTFKQIDPTGAVTAIGGGGFGQNTTINLPNSSSTPVPALNLVTALTSNTPGSEASSFTTNLLNGGVAYPSVSLVPAGQTTDTISGAAAWTWNLNVGGVQKGQLSVGSTGELLLFGTLAGGDVGIGSISDGVLVQIGHSLGMEARGGIALQACQGAGVALASTLAITATAPNGGNTFTVTAGTGPVNLMAASTFDFGAEINLYFTVAGTINHNQTPSGSNLPLLLAGSTSFAVPIGGRIKFVRINGVGWVELSRTVP